jgi:hypothetical protein
VVGDILGAMVTAFNVVDGAIQSAFGGASIGGILGFLVAMRGALAVVSLVDLAISLLITGPLALLATSLAPIITGMTAIAAVIGWPALLVAGIVLLVAALLGFTPMLDVAKGNFEALWNLIKAFAGYIADTLVTNIGTLVSSFQNGWATIYYWVTYYLGLAGQYIDAFYAKVKAIGDAIAAVLGGGGGSPAAVANIPVAGAAAGGLQRGPGSGTSDSLLRRLSDGEYVVKARAVKYWGVRVLHSINNMVSPKGYAAGGYVDSLGGAMAPAGRGGGLAAYQAAAALEGRVSVDLSHNGTTFHGLLAPAAVARSLTRYASGQQRVSLGRRSTAWGAARSA